MYHGAEFELALRAAAAQVVGRRVEHAVILDADGVVLWAGRGTRTHVGTPHTGRTCTVHNHPSNGPLSHQDVALAINGDEIEAVAVGEQYTYRLFPVGPRWPALNPLAKEVMYDWRRGFLNGHDACRRLAAVWPGISYLRLPTRAWIGGATFTAPATGPAQGLRP